MEPLKHECGVAMDTTVGNRWNIIRKSRNLDVWLEQAVSAGWKNNITATGMGWAGLCQTGGQSR